MQSDINQGYPLNKLGVGKTKFLLLLVFLTSDSINAATCTGVVPPFNTPAYTGTGNDLNNGFSTLYRGTYSDSLNPSAYFEGIGSHPGVDITHDDQKVHVDTTTSVIAICDGEVIRVTKDNQYNGGWGNSVVLRHDVPGTGSVFSTYAHLDTKTFPSWKIGDSIKQGVRIGKIDSTGKSSGNHLHFQIDKDTQNNHPYWPIGRSVSTSDIDGLIASKTYNPMQYLLDHSSTITLLAQDDIITPQSGAAIHVDVLVNDAVPNGSQLTITNFTQGTNGSVILSQIGIVYTPNSGFVGTDSFMYTISDSSGATASATVNVTVIPATFTNGDIVEVSPSASPHLNVRDVANGNILGTQDPGVQGVVMSGPEYVSGFWWWEIYFNSGSDGWVAEDFIQRVDSSVDQVVLQPGPSQGKDIWTTSTFSYSGNNGEPGGGLDNEELRVGGWGDYYHSLIQFDLTGLPMTASSARIELYAFNKTDERFPVGMWLDRITEFWDWRIQGTGSDFERLWWADRPNAIQWNGDASQPLPAPALDQWYSIDVTNLYNAWQASGSSISNFGVQLRPTSNNQNQNFFYSSDYTGDPTRRPKLVVVP